MDQVSDSGSAMFSAASFAGVIGDRRNLEPGQDLEEETLQLPPVVAFYGFRGGAGRTTALAHVAAHLASRPVQIVAIDLDLEAPGLHRVLACPEPEEDRGTLALMREAATEDPSSELRLAPHVLKSQLDLRAPIRVVPAGRLSERYLERLEDLGVPLWHVAEGPSPLQALVDQVKTELEPQAIFLDCRTGLSGLSASAMFHVADVVVCFIPMSEQSLDGLSVFLCAARAAKARRRGRPSVLLVPSMVPDGPEARQRLNEWFVPEIERCYAKAVLGRSLDEDEISIAEQVPVVREGIEYRRGIALADHVRGDSAQLSGGAYLPLIGELDKLLGQGQPSVTVTIQAGKVLNELAETGELKNLAFAESTSPEQIVKKFIEPSDFKAIVDRATWYVIGSKGAGKTWLWTYLLSTAVKLLSSEMTYLAGHGPGEDVLTASAFRELESDKKAQMVQRQTHGALWLLYAAKRLLAKHADVAEGVVGRLRAEEKAFVRSLADAEDGDLQMELGRILAFDRAATLAERLVRALDEELLLRGKPAVTLLYDGLDVGFGSDAKSIERRDRYVNALVEACEQLRGATKRIFFKIFLREDIFSEVSIQNQSHLAAATVELNWEPRDLWVLALNLLSSSPHFLDCVRTIDRTAGPEKWPADDETRQRLLIPLWGEQLEAGNKISTAAFVQRRTADGRDRLFPRTLVQLLAAAVEHQQTMESRSDRVLRSAAIQAGYKRASERRVEDLRKEYDALGRYLDGLKGMTPTGTEEELCKHIKGHFKLSAIPAAKARGAAAGMLHAGPRGWHGVIERLQDVGVLRKYKRARGESGELKYEIALLYRPGLRIKAYGV